MEVKAFWRSCQVPVPPLYSNALGLRNLCVYVRDKQINLVYRFGQHRPKQVISHPDLIRCTKVGIDCVSGR
jgi:hypothetical protein